MKKAYVSLPITGQDIEAVKARAKAAAQYLTEKGFEPVTPFDVSPNDEATYSEHMGNDIKALMDCDTVLFLRGWESSKGCQLERQAAMIYGKEMMHDASYPCVPELSRVLPYPPFMIGDIVTYTDCSGTIALYSGIQPEKNDSGDDVYHSYLGVCREGEYNTLYHGNLVFADDIRLATPKEQERFIVRLDMEIGNLKNKIRAYERKEEENHRCESTLPDEGSVGCMEG